MSAASFLRLIGSLALVSPLAGCAPGAGSSDEPFVVQSNIGTTLEAQPLGRFDSPWAMCFLPDGRLLVTEKGGRLLIVDTSTDERTVVRGLPPVRAEGQGGLGDVILHPNFETNDYVYFSYVEREGRLSGAAVARVRLVDADHANLEDLEVVWRQSPKVTGTGHYGHRLAFGPDGLLYITSGERQKFTPAQDLAQNLGKVLRLHDDGTPAIDNPFAAQGGIAAEVFTLGHRNPLGIAFDTDGTLWIHEMGPRGGDELNRIERGLDYGWPVVSNGDHYDGREIPDHDTRPDRAAPVISWTPAIAPAGLVIHDGERLPEWRGSGLIGGLAAEALVRVSLDAEPRELERFAMPTRVREIELGPDGHVYVLEDRAGARLLRLEVIAE